ncbi:HI1506-related protein [Nevskia ramosa]|uniref:HI1506-related protein n=1 Tax=Nevskia ramosa TaxID=64002 RepID=UPI0023524092|nr:HI1506-related protein [Nevskia ramosa]
MSDDKTPPAASPTKQKTPALRIAAKSEGFRRAGIAHSTTAIDYKAGKFTVEQVEALKNDPMLVVVELG